MNKRILRSYHSFDYEKTLIKESVNDVVSDVIVLSGILQKADTLNQNGRIYPRHILEREVRNYQKFILENRALGECDHPESSVVSLKNVSHVVTEAYLDGDVVYGKIRLLNTPSGKILQNLVADKVKLGISSRGVGSTERRGDYQVVQDDFQLICWDVVSEPSTPMAFMMPEQNKNESYQDDVLDKLAENITPGNDKIYKILKELTIYKK